MAAAPCQEGAGGCFDRRGRRGGVGRDDRDAQAGGQEVGRAGGVRLRVRVTGARRGEDDRAGAVGGSAPAGLQQAGLEGVDQEGVGAEGAAKWVRAREAAAISGMSCLTW